MEEFDEGLYHVGVICERLSFTRPDPVKPEGYTETLSGNWDDVPAWAIRRINFLEEQLQLNDERRCPKMHDMCPDVPEHTCQTVKHCYPYLCNGACGHNEIWVSDEAKKLLKEKELI